MSIINVDKIGPVGGGSTITVAAGIASYTGKINCPEFDNNPSFTGNVTIAGNLGVAGTITYEDVDRVDATGISTFREGFGVGPLTGIALTAYKDGSIRTTGIITATSFSGTASTATSAAKAYALDSAANITTGIITATAFIPTVGQLSNRNLIINGGFQVHQRGNLTHSYSWAGDRFQNRTGSSTVISQSTTVPAGFANSMSLAASSGTATLQWNTLLEVGNNITGTNIGNYYSANSKWTISIWATVAVNVKVQFCNDFGAGDAQVIQASTAMTSTGETSNTFTRYKLTFDIASVTPHANNKGLQIHFATSSAASAIKYTGAQLERGTVATPFEHRSYNDELAGCQRYYIQYDVNTGATWNARMNGSGNSDGYIDFPVEMRANPTGSVTFNTAVCEQGSTGKTVSGISATGYGRRMGHGRCSLSQSGTNGYASYNRLTGTSKLMFSAEF